MYEVPGVNNQLHDQIALEKILYWGPGLKLYVDDMNDLGSVRSLPSEEETPLTTYVYGSDYVTSAFFGYKEA